MGTTGRIRWSEMTEKQKEQCRKRRERKTLKYQGEWPPAPETEFDLSDAEEDAE